MDTVLNWLWQGGVVVAALAVMLFALKRACANVRYVVCWTAALFVIALPVLAALQPVASVDGIGMAEHDAIVRLPDVWWTSTRVIVGAAALWAGINILRLLSAIVAIRRVRLRSHALPAHLESLLPHWRRIRDEGRRATLVLSSSVTSAAVLGWGSPMIAVAPSLVRTLNLDDLDRVLIHEWAHVQRRDDIVNILQIVLRLIGGWHPALWWIDRRLHIEREIACDEMTVTLTGHPKAYAECLIKLSGLKRTPRAVRPAPAIFTRSDLRPRVSKIVSRKHAIPPISSRMLAVAIVLLLCLVSVAVAGLTPVTAFAEPVLLASTLTRGISPSQSVPAAAASSNVRTRPSQRRPMTRASSHGPTTERAISPHRAIPRAVPSESTEPNAVTPVPALTAPYAPGAASPPASTVAVDATPVPLTPPSVPTVTGESPRSPWSAAANGGAAIGRKSKDAGVATAGFFTRFAKRVGGSF
jgi:D-alanyl-D-alanine endopeptidase (penicillin-binding protein 7)